MEEPRIAVIPADTILDITDHRSRIAGAFWWATMVDEAITREWVMNVGQRSVGGERLPRGRWMDSLDHS